MVVERQPVDDLVHGIALRGERLSVQPTHLESAPQTLGRRIVPAVSFATHRRLHAVALERGLEFVAAVLLGFKESSQRRLLERGILGDQAPRRAFAIRGSCEVSH